MIDPFECGSMECVTFSLRSDATDCLKSSLSHSNCVAQRNLQFNSKISFAVDPRSRVLFWGSSGRWIRCAIAACRSLCTSRWCYWDGKWRQYCRPDTLERFRFSESFSGFHESHLRMRDVPKCRTIAECKMNFCCRPRQLVLSIDPKATKRKSRKLKLSSPTIGRVFEPQLEHAEELFDIDEDILLFQNYLRKLLVIFFLHHYLININT